MAPWSEFTATAPFIADVFNRRMAAADCLCLLATLRSDGFPRISPMEPRAFEDQLWLAGMPGTQKFLDLDRDPRFALHIATADSHAPEGDAKIWGTVENVRDRKLHARFADFILAESGYRIQRRQDHFFKLDVRGAASVTHEDGHMYITQWHDGHPETRVRKS